MGQPGWGGVDPLAPGRVRTLGRLSDPDLAVVLHGTTMLVAPSRAEGFGLSVLEAMAAGVPVLSSDAPALVEVGGGATVVVPRNDPVALAEAIRELAADPGRRARLAASGLARAASYSWAAAARLWDVYGALGSDRAAGP